MIKASRLALLAKYWCTVARSFISQAIIALFLSVEVNQESASSKGPRAQVNNKSEGCSNAYLESKNSRQNGEISSCIEWKVSVDFNICLQKIDSIEGADSSFVRDFITEVVSKPCLWYSQLLSFSLKIHSSHFSCQERHRNETHTAILKRVHRIRPFLLFVKNVGSYQENSEGLQHSSLISLPPTWTDWDLIEPR